MEDFSQVIKWQQLLAEEGCLPALRGHGCESKHQPHAWVTALLSATSPKHEPSIDHAGWDHTETPGIISDAEHRVRGTSVFFSLGRCKEVKGENW